MLDNQNTRLPAALYEVFPPAEVRRLAGKPEIRSTVIVMSATRGGALARGRSPRVVTPARALVVPSS